MTPEELDQLDRLRSESLQQLYEARDQIPHTDADGAYFLIGVCYGILRRLLRGLLTPAQVAELAEPIHAEFAKHWPHINPAYMELLAQLYAAKDDPQ